MADRIIIKNTSQEVNLDNIQATDVLNGEMLLVREVNKERLYCKNSAGEISKIHRIADAGEFESEKDYVDLGLPSGLLWAKKNIGAETEEDAGLYFQWGDTVGYTTEQIGVDKQFASDWSDYKFGYKSDFTKYTGTDRDGLTTLEPADDAATQIMGSDWRMPTREEFLELIDNTTVMLVLNENEEVESNGGGIGNVKFPEKYEIIKGIKFYNRNNFSKYIYFPAGGYSMNGGNSNMSKECYIWSANIYDHSTYFYTAFCLNISNGSYEMLCRTSNYNRYLGGNIRPVTSSKS